MILVGESLNGTIMDVGMAILDKDENYILDLAKTQIDCGANLLDINAGVAGGEETEDLLWAIKTIQGKFSIPICLDSDDPQALKSAFSVTQNPEKCLINSVSGDPKKLDLIFPIVSEFKCGVVALCLDDKGIPHDVDSRLEIADRIMASALQHGIKPEQLYFDPLVFSISTDTMAGNTTMKTLIALKTKYPTSKSICGLSNASHGLPQRKLLNRTFLVMNYALGMDAFIVDVRDSALMATVFAARALTGQDARSAGYISAFRQHKLG